jgi:DNA polymerase
MQVLIEYLRQLEGKGQTHVRLDEEAKAVLREFYKAGRAPRKAAVPRRPSPRPTRAAAPAPVSAPQEVVATGGTPEEQLESLRMQAETWAPALSLGTLRETMVFATGNPQADLMFVGEAPGWEEERKREPFVGKAGEKLNLILKAMGLRREDVYISNICKFRPAMARQTTSNRKPTHEEMDACLPFVQREIEIVRPKCLVALGATAAQGLLGTTEGIGRLRGQWFEYQGIPLRATYHPSYLLHNKEAMAEKRKVWEDMLTIMEALKMPISDKQRGYFR